MTQKTVFALFDDGKRSYFNALKDNSKYKVISIGINRKHQENENYKIIDLRISNDKLFDELDKLPKPDIILASPPCESWSQADNPCNMWSKISNDNIEIKNKDFFDDWNKNQTNSFKKRNFFKKEAKRIIGEDTIASTLAIIEYYNPEVWVIENPLTSRIWQWIESHINTKGFKNIAHYNAYSDSFSKKPTNFFSNKKLNLKKSNLKSKNWSEVCGYDTRSSIPTDLIKDIVKQLEEN